MKARRAFGLIETLLATVLFGLLLTLIFSVLVPMLAASRRGANQSDLRQMAAIAVEVLTRKIEESSAPGLSLFTNPMVLSVHPVLDLTQGGETLWNREVSLFVRDSSALYLQPYPAPSQARPHRWAALTDLTAVVGGSPSRRLLASDVKNWSVAGLDEHGLRPPLKLTLELERPAPGDVTQHFTLEAYAAPRVKSGR